MLAENCFGHGRVLVQLGRTSDGNTLPVAGAVVARRLLDASVPMNGLIQRAAKNG